MYPEEIMEEASQQEDELETRVQQDQEHQVNRTEDVLEKVSSDSQIDIQKQEYSLEADQP